MIIMKKQALPSESDPSSANKSGSTETPSSDCPPMPLRLVALDEGPDIELDRAMMVVGRHPQCDARLDSIRVSRRHCCMTQDNGELVVRDLGSTNGIRINGQRVEIGRLRPGDELSIAHIRYRVECGPGPQEMTMADTLKGRSEDGHHNPYQVRPVV
ncbi:MAG TPA: FHA domain-containing protein, partial [Isosphaeraceae bacterium]